MLGDTYIIDCPCSVSTDTLNKLFTNCVSFISIPYSCPFPPLMSTEYSQLHGTCFFKYGKYYAYIIETCVLLHLWRNSKWFPHNTYVLISRLWITIILELWRLKEHNKMGIRMFLWSTPLTQHTGQHCELCWDDVSKRWWNLWMLLIRLRWHTKFKTLWAKSTDTLTGVSKVWLWEAIIT